MEPKSGLPNVKNEGNNKCWRVNGHAGGEDDAAPLCNGGLGRYIGLVFAYMHKLRQGDVSLSPPRPSSPCMETPEREIWLKIAA